MSLWPVEDRVTRQWMTTLHEGRLVRKLSTADAVREAGLTVLRERRQHRTAEGPLRLATKLGRNRVAPPREVAVETEKIYKSNALHRYR